MKVKQLLEEAGTAFLLPLRLQISGTDSLLLGGMPSLLKEIGFPSMPMVISQKHVGYALDGTYPKERFRKGHIFEESELAKLPDKIADPVAITYDPKRPDSLVIYVDMVNTEGDTVVAPISIGETRNVGGKEANTNALRTVFEQENGPEMIASAIKLDSNSRHTLFYLNKEKALELDIPHDMKAIVQNAQPGINHIVNAPGSLVNTTIKNQTDTLFSGFRGSVALRKNFGKMRGGKVGAAPDSML